MGNMHRENVKKVLNQCIYPKKTYARENVVILLEKGKWMRYNTDTLKSALTS